MNTLRTALRLALVALFGLCAADGISQVRGLRLMSPAWENVAVCAFFLLAGTVLALAWLQRDGRALRRVRLWSALVLLGGVALLILLWVALVANFPTLWLELFLYALAVVATPVVSCTVMFWPIFGWVMLLLISMKMCRELKKKTGTEL